MSQNEENFDEIVSVWYLLEESFLHKWIFDLFGVKKNRICYRLCSTMFANWAWWVLPECKWPKGMCGSLNMLDSRSSIIRRWAPLVNVCHCEGRLWDPPLSLVRASLFLSAFVSRCQKLRSSRAAPTQKLPCVPSRW